MMKILVLLLLVTALLSPCVASAGVKIGNIQFDDRGKIIFANTSSGKIIFPDKTEQGSATAKGDPGPKGDLGDKGDKGDKGDPGTPGSQVTRDAMCQVYSTAGLQLPPFCVKKAIFLTSQTYNGNLGGLSGADQKCQNLANIAGLSGMFKAWLSDSTISAKDRLNHNPAPYVRTDGALVANNWFDLVDGNLKDAIICDENAACTPYIYIEAEGRSATAYTGTSRLGKSVRISGGEVTSSGFTSRNFCMDWTSESNEYNPDYYVYGSAGSIDFNWTEAYGAGDCSYQYRLYCIEQ